MKNPFKNAELHRYFDAYVEMYHDGKLRNADGSPCCGGSSRSMFWRGYDGVENILATKGSLNYAAFRAGQEVKKSETKSKSSRKKARRKAPFKDKFLADFYRITTALAHDPTSELYVQAPGHRDHGKRRTGAMHRCCFWAGVEFVEDGPIVVNGKKLAKTVVGVKSGTLGHAAYRAGKDFAKKKKK